VNPTWIVPAWTAPDGSRHYAAYSTAATPHDQEQAMQRAVADCRKQRGTSLRIQIVDSVTMAKATVRPKVSA